MIHFAPVMTVYPRKYIPLYFLTRTKTTILQWWKNPLSLSVRLSINWYDGFVFIIRKIPKIYVRSMIGSKSKKKLPIIAYKRFDTSPNSPNPVKLPSIGHVVHFSTQKGKCKIIFASSRMATKFSFTFTRTRCLTRIIRPHLNFK